MDGFAGNPPVDAKSPYGVGVPLAGEARAVTGDEATWPIGVLVTGPSSADPIGIHVGRLTWRRLDGATRPAMRRVRCCWRP